MSGIEKQSNSSRGGRREGSGRKPGVRNKKTVELLTAVETTGITPLEYLLSVMRDDAEERSVRMQAATSAAPYCHSKLSAMTVSGDEDNPLHLIQKIERVVIDSKD